MKSFKIIIFLCFSFCCSNISTSATFDTSTNWLETSISGDISQQSRVFRVWVPDSLVDVNGAIFFWPGDGQHWEYRASDPKFQAVAESLDFALIGIGSSGTFGIYFPAENEKALLHMMQAAANASGHPELAAAPHMHTGFSRGAWTSAFNGQHASERIIAYAPIRGASSSFYSFGVWPETVCKIPGIFLPGGREPNSLCKCSVVEDVFEELRGNDYPAAFAVDRGIGHDPDAGQSWEMGLYYMAETCRKRVDLTGGWPAVTNGFVTLPNLALTNGWLVQSEDFNTNGANNTSIQSYPFPDIAPYNAYTGDVANASWLPSEGAAMAYRAFAATDGTLYSSVNNGFRNGPLIITNLYAFSVYTNGQTFAAEINPRTFDDSRTIQSMDLYLDATLISTDTNSADGWAFSTPISNTWRGVHAVIVVAEATTGERTSCFRIIVVNDDP